jgi:hypothetical protein
MGCPMAPPPSQFPNAQAAIDRMRASTMCARGIQAENAKVDFLGPKDRVRVDVSLIAVKQANLHLDVFAFNNTVATLVTDGTSFALANMQTKQFLYGPATSSNMARLTTLDIPGHVLVAALLGQAPILKHQDSAATIAWDGSGYYVVKFPGTNDSSEELHLVPHPDDWNKPFAEQRVRVLDVLVQQKGYVLYHADFDEHKPTTTADGIAPVIPGDPTIPPSGPPCSAEIPMRIHVEVPEEGNDVRFRYDTVRWNPPLQPNIFQLSPQAFPGLQVINVANAVFAPTGASSNAKP